MIPQLRVRTEYSYKACYGPMPRVVNALEQLGSVSAGIVDTSGTWGHVAWQKALKDSDVRPMYGTEFTIEKGELRPKCWVLATDLAPFYRLSSQNPTTEEEMIGVKGVIRFAGSALTNPEAFDYIDVNPSSSIEIKRAIELHRATGKPLVITSDNNYPAPEDEERFLAWDDSRRMTPQHIMSEDELREYFEPYMTRAEWHDAVVNTCAVAGRCMGLELREAPMISVEGDFAGLVAKGKEFRLERGHIGEWTDEYEARLQRELKLVAEKEYESYFFVVADMICWAKDRMLVGPARGSAAGSLVCYLLRITEVDPIPYNLIFERFIDVNRFDLPDIDVDFNDKKRPDVFEYLKEKYGRDNVARIGSVSRLKPRSVIAHVGKKLGVPHGATFGVANVLVEHSSGDARYGHALEDTLTGTQAGRDFMKLYPEASLMAELENHASHSGQHAAGTIVSNEPVTEYCTVRDGIAHIDKKDAEVLNLLKIDALGLRTLGVIEDTGCITPDELYDLKLDDPEVFRMINEQKFSGLFQFEGAAQRSVSVQVDVTDFKHIDHITALARPGPLGGGAAQTYIQRSAGREEIAYRHPTMAEYLGDTLGVVLYQEQVMRICREIGKFSWADTADIRRIMSKSIGKEFFDSYGERFINGAKENGIPKEDAEIIWNEICSFGSWGMNKSHTCSYAVISYWCAYMKRYHPLEYAAASLRNAKDAEQTVEILRELNKEGVPFVPFDPDLSDANWSVADGKLIGGYTNLVGIGPIKALHYINKRNEKGLNDTDRLSLSKRAIKHNDLTPAHTLWSDIYDNPEQYNIHGKVKQFSELKDRESSVIIAMLVRQDRRDKNEAVLVSKREGKVMKGQTLFLDSFMVDDTVSQPVRVRTQPRDWFQIGEPMAERAVPKQDWFLIRGQWLEQFSMFIAEKVKCLTNKEMFE